MHINSNLAVAVIALAATIGAASAAEQFTTLTGASVEPLTAQEMESVVGTLGGIQVTLLTTTANPELFVALTLVHATTQAFCATCDATVGP